MNQLSTPPQQVTVNIYDQTYHLAGQNPEHIRRLAEVVDQKMRAVASHGRTADSLRVAVLAALNLADELASAQSRPAQAPTLTQAAAPAPALPASPAIRQGHARAATLSGLLDEVLDERRAG